MVGLVSRSLALILSPILMALAVGIGDENDRGCPVQLCRIQREMTGDDRFPLRADAGSAARIAGPGKRVRPVVAAANMP